MASMRPQTFPSQRHEERRSDARTLRDKKRLTRLLLMFEVSQAEPVRPKQLADAVGMTIQGVLNHLDELRQARHVEHSSDGYNLSALGRQELLESMLDIKRYVDDAVLRLNVIDACSAVAGNKIREGDPLGLFMVEGELVAFGGRDSSSKGKALSSAERGEEVLVGDLEGVVEINTARLNLVRVPGAREGGSRRLGTRALQASLGDLDMRTVHAGAVGTEGRAALRRLGLEPAFRFAPVQAAFNAAQLGLEALLLVPGPEMKEVLGELESYNASAPERVPIAILSPGGPARFARRD
ncbi:MAG: hypothetical protein HY556_11815 [Euryarchaeota archaeon]|nr:hypothetical protein [Euryarchaeota archaeon]